MGHGFMTEDMVIEDGKGRRFELPQPNNYADLVIYLVHGTWGSPEEHWSDEFIGFLMDEFNIPRGNIHAPEWTGTLGGDIRGSGGLLLAINIQSNPQINTDTNMLIVGYSHGGNVAKENLNFLHDIFGFDLGNTTLLTVATPIITSHQLNQATRESLGFLFNAFNNYDSVQLAGTMHITGSRAAEPGFIVDGTLIQKIVGGRFLHSANRNIPVTRYIPRGTDNVAGLAAHSAMHNNPNVWRYYFLYLLMNSFNEVGGCE